MFAIGACVGLLGGAYLIDALSEYYYVFWIVGPIATLVGIAFVVTMSKITPEKFRRIVQHHKENPTPLKTHLKNFWENFKTIDLIGAALVTIGTGLFLVGLSLVLPQLNKLLTYHSLTRKGGHLR